MPDPNSAKNPSRSAPPLAEVRRILDRYRRSTEAARPRAVRRPTDGPPTLRARRRDNEEPVDS